MRVERELEIGKWLKTAETELEIKPNQYFALVRLLEDFHNEQLRLYGVNQQRELLVAYEMHCRKTAGCDEDRVMCEILADKFLATNCG